MTVRPLSFERLIAMSSVVCSAMSGSFAPVRWRAPPSSRGAGISGGRNCGLCVPGASVIAVSFFSFLTLLGRNDRTVAHKFHERAVRITKIDRGTRPFRAEPLHWPALDGNSAGFQMGDRTFDRSLPLQAQLALSPFPPHTPHLYP